MTTRSITIRQQRVSITSTTHTAYELEHVRWTARYRLSEQMQRNGDYDLRRTLLNANLLDSLDDWQTRHPYVRPAPVVLPQPTSPSNDSTPPPVMVRDFAAMSAQKMASVTTPSVSAVAVIDDDDDDDELFEDESDSDDSDPLDVPHTATSLTSGSSESESDEDDDDIWDSEYHDSDLHTSPFSLNLSRSATTIDLDGLDLTSTAHDTYLHERKPVLEIAEVDDEDDEEDDEEEDDRSPMRLPSPPPARERRRARKAAPGLLMPRLQRARPAWRDGMGAVAAGV